MRRFGKLVPLVRRRRRIGPVVIIGAAFLGFAGAYGLLSPDQSSVVARSALIEGMPSIARTAETAAESCDIKGNISVSTGERIYHVPGQEYYDETRISPGKGERYFCSEAEARAAGWRRSKV